MSRDVSVPDHAERRRGHGVVVLNLAHHLGVRTSQMVSASAVTWLGQMCLGITTPNPRALQTSKETGKRGHTEGNNTRNATALL